MVNQLGSPAAAVHEHQLPVMMAKDAVSPPFANDALDGLIAYVQAAAVCDAVKTCPPIATVAVLAPAAFAAAEIATLPFPVPDAPLRTFSQVGSPLEALQLHQLPVVTATVIVPPPAPGD